jgi:DNA-binding transcriptional MerR regulator
VVVVDNGVLCTLDELTDQVESALAVDYPGAPTGRVRDVPDQRVIRWYVTRGLVDRPLASRGRVALYGRRHLLQLVAIKRRQADGRSLAEIQAELAGATDDRLAEVAQLPVTRVVGGEGRRTASSQSSPLSSAARRARFWADRPALAAVASHAPRERNASQDASQDVAQIEPEGGRVHAGDAEIVTLRGVRLAPGVTLLIEDGAGPLADLTDVAAIRAAARPLLDLLAARRHPPQAPQTPNEE